MTQYQTGTVTVVQGKNCVSGESCAWITNNVQAGHTFKIEDDDALYSIGAVTTELTFSLTSPYVGASVSGESYQVGRDFTDNYSLPEIWTGDKDWPFHLTQSLRLIDTQMKTTVDSVVEAAEKTVVDQGEAVTVNLAVADLNKVHLLKSSGETAVNLPSVDNDDVGSWIDFRKRGSGEVTINRADSDLINGQTYCKNATEQTFAMVVLLLEEETKWGQGPAIGDWETST